MTQDTGRVLVAERHQITGMHGLVSECPSSPNTKMLHHVCLFVMRL